MHILALLIGYLLGSLPSGYLYCRFVCGKDIRSFGSGNIGTTNTLRVAGKKGALVVLAADMGKAILACYLGGLLGGEQTWAELAGMMAIAGHCFPVWLKFKGGKGAACGIGYLLFFWPWGALCCALAFIAVFLISGMVSAGTIITVLFACGLIAFSASAPLDFWPVLVIAVLIIWKHKSNIQRIIQGKENKILWKNRQLF